MKKRELTQEEKDLITASEMVRKYIAAEDWEACQKVIPEYMEQYPDSAWPHNLMGIMLESQRKHPQAMKHFRAAWSLDPSFTPADENMEQYTDYESAVRVKPVYGKIIF